MPKKFRNLNLTILYLYLFFLCETIIFFLKALEIGWCFFVFFS